MLIVPGKIGNIGRTRGRAQSSAPPSDFNPIANAKLAAFYSALDPASVTATQWLDQSVNGKHADLKGTVTYSSGDTSTKGIPALKWPTSPTTLNGFTLPALTIAEMIWIGTYGTGVEQTVSSSAWVIAGVGVSGYTPINTINVSNDYFYTSTGLTAVQPQNLMLPSPLPMLQAVENLRMVTPMAGTSWRLGYKDNSTSSAASSWRGSMSAVLVFSSPLTDMERLAYFDYLNAYFNGEAGVSTKVYTKTDVVVPKPVEMTSGNGTYYPTIVDMSTVANFPGTHAVYYSSDHADGNGGIYMSTVNGDPSDPTNYKNYDQALADGDFNYLATKPASNPIYVDTVVGSQTETPCIRKVGSTLVMTYQNAGSGHNQSTLRAMGTDGVNFTRDKVVVDYDPALSVGDGHTGYLVWALNPFPDVPYTYVGYSLHGGQNQSYLAQWGCNDPTVDIWTKITVLQKVAGRIKDGGRSLSWITMDTGSFRTVPQGISVLCSMAADGAGASARDAGIYEVLLDSKGTTVIGLPIQVIAKTGLLYDSGEITTAGIVPYGDHFSGVYNAASGANAKVVAGFSAENVSYTPNFPPLIPAIPAVTTDTNYDFSTMGSLPSGTTVVSAGTVAPTVAFTANGIEITGSTGTIDGQEYIYFDAGFVPNTAGYIEFWVTDWRTLSADTKRWPYMGFSSSKVAPASITDGFFMNNGDGTSNLMYRNVLKAGANTRVQDTTSGGFGYNYIQANAPKRYGFRWFVKANRFILLGEGGNEMGEIVDIAETAINKALTYYFFFGTRAKGTSNVEAIKTVGMRVG